MIINDHVSAYRHVLVLTNAVKKGLYCLLLTCYKHSYITEEKCSGFFLQPVMVLLGGGGGDWNSPPSHYLEPSDALQPTYNLYSVRNRIRLC